MILREEITHQFNELADWFDKIAASTNMTCTHELSTRRAKMWREQASKVANLRCETCKWWREGNAKLSYKCLNDDVPGILYPGYDFYCGKWEKK